MARLVGRAETAPEHCGQHQDAGKTPHHDNRKSAHRGTLTKWLAEDPALAEHWAGSDSAVTAFLIKWQADHSEDVAKWRAASKMR